MPTIDWWGWLAQIGIAVPDAPNIVSLAVAAAGVAIAYWIGWFAGQRLGPGLTTRIYTLAGRSEGVNAKRVAVLLDYGIVGVLLLVIGDVAQFGGYAAMVLALALGVAAAFLAYELCRAVRLGSVAAWLLAGIALVSVTAGRLGGLRPLVQGLDAAGVTVGKTHVTLLTLVNFVVVAAVLLVLARIANRVVAHSIGRAGRLDPSQRLLAQKLGGLAVVAVAVLLGIDVLGIDLTALTVFSGAAGLAIGFGMQKTLGNLIAGLILLMDRSIKPGDVIVVGDTFGQIGKIGIRAVSVVTRDGKEHLIPNEKLMTDPVENWSYSSRNVRVHIPIGVSYDADLALAQRLMVEAASAAARVLPAPKPSVWLKGFGDNAVDHDILVWVADPEAGVGNVRSDILNRVWRLFKDNGIGLPYPQRDVHVKEWPAAAPAERDA